MTASFNTSFFNTSAAAESRDCKKAFRSTALNNASKREQLSLLELSSESIKGESQYFSVDVVDFENEVHTFEVEAESEAEASEQAADMAMSAGVQVSYCNVYSYQ